MKSIEDVPPREELVTYPLGKVKEIRDNIENIPIEDCDAYYMELLQEFLKEEEVTRFELQSVEVERDALSLIPEENLKPRKNLIFRIALKMSGQRELDDIEAAKAVSSQLRDYLNNDTFYSLKAGETVVSTYDLNGYLINTSIAGSHTLGEFRALEQPEPEYSAQTIAYCFKEKDLELSLRKFGAIQETKELYVEYLIYDSFFVGGKFQSGEDAASSSEAMLAAISEEIREYLLREDAVAQYVEENNLELLTISFYNGIFGEPYPAFHSKI